MRNCLNKFCLRPFLEDRNDATKKCCGSGNYLIYDSHSETRGSSSVVSKNCHLHCDFSDNYIYFVSDVMQEFGDKSNCNYIWHVNIMNAHSGAEKLET